MHYLNGQWVESKDLNVSAFDLSVIRGYGVFDFLRTYDHKPFHLDPHIDRLFNSAKVLDIDIPATKKQIVDIVYAGIKKNDQPDFNIRIVVTGGGVDDDGMTPGKHSLVVMFTKAHDYPKKYYTHGISVITYPHVRAFHEAKTLNYLSAIQAIKAARKASALEALYTDHNEHILEGTTSNFFAVKGGTIITPKDTILAGITRNVIFEIADELHVPVQKRAIPLAEIKSVQEAFVTASNKEVMPVVKIDGQAIGDGVVGTVTKKIVEEYGLRTR